MLRVNDINDQSAVPPRAQPVWAYEFSDRTGLDTQICRTGLAGQDVMSGRALPPLPSSFLFFVLDLDGLMMIISLQWISG